MRERTPDTTQEHIIFDTAVGRSRQRETCGIAPLFLKYIPDF
jgi:hypothetical protein